MKLNNQPLGQNPTPANNQNSASIDERANAVATMADFSNMHLITRDRRLLDLSLMVSREYVKLALLPVNDHLPLVRVFEAASHDWTEFTGTFGELIDSIPLTKEQADRFKQDGLLPECVETFIAANVHLGFPEPDDAIPKLDAQVLQLSIKEAFRKIRSGYLELEIVRRQDGNELFRNLDGVEATIPTQRPASMTSEQSKAVGSFLDLLDGYIDYGDLLNNSDRLEREAEGTAQLNGLNQLGLGVFTGCYQTKVSIAGRSFSLRTLRIVIATTNDPRTKCKADGTKFLTVAIPRTNRVDGEDDAGLGENANDVTSSPQEVLAAIFESMEALREEIRTQAVAKQEMSPQVVKGERVVPDVTIEMGTKLETLHADIRDLKQIANPLPAAMANIEKKIAIVQQHVRGVPIMQSELAEAQVVPEALAVEIQNRISDILAPEEQEIWRAMRNAKGSQKDALVRLRQSGTVKSAPTLSRRVKEINEKLIKNNLPRCDVSTPDIRFRRSGGYANNDGKTVPEEISAIEQDWTRDPVVFDKIMRAYISALPEDRDEFHLGYPGIKEEAVEFRKRYGMKSG